MRSFVGGGVSEEVLLPAHFGVKEVFVAAWPLAASRVRSTGRDPSWPGRSPLTRTDAGDIRRARLSQCGEVRSITWTDTQTMGDSLPASQFMPSSV